jgi:integrase
MSQTALVLIDREMAPAQGGETSPALVYLARLAAGSRKTMLAALVRITRIFTRCEHAKTKTEIRRGRRVSSRLLCSACDPRIFPWARLRYKETQWLRSELEQSAAPATANKALAALRGVLQEAWQLGQIPAEDYHRAVAVKGIKGSRLPKGRSLAYTEIRGLLEACQSDESPAGKRDAALIAVLRCGLRRAEAAGLALADIDPAGFLNVRGKGNKDRRVPLAAGAADLLKAWLSVRGGEPGALFTPINKGGRVQLRAMGAEAIAVALSKRAREAGIERAFSPHDFRRTTAGDLLDSGADLVTVQKILGHASPTTTAIYDRRPEGAMKAAMARIRV